MKRRPGKPRPARKSKVARARSSASQPTGVVAPPAPTKRPTYLEAVSLYERGVQALQMRDYASAIEDLGAVLDRYPDERELHERVRLYLKVCERQTASPSSVPNSPEERVYAATLALNAGEYDRAVESLRSLTQIEPGNDHAQYVLAVAHTLRGDREAALGYLRRAIELNPENRSLARQDPDLDTLRRDEGFRVMLESFPLSRRKSRRHLR